MNINRSYSDLLRRHRAARGLEPGGVASDLPVDPAAAPGRGGGAVGDFLSMVDRGLDADPLAKAQMALNNWKGSGYGGLTNLGPAAHRLGSLAITGARALPVAAPALFGALQGYEEGGPGGAAVGAAAPVLGAIAGQALIPIPVVGAAIGGMVGSALGGGVNSAIRGAVDDAQYGIDSPLAGLGNALDPFFKSNSERTADQVTRQLNDPARQALIAEQQRRENEAQQRRYNDMLTQLAATPLSIG